MCDVSRNLCNTINQSLPLSRKASRLFKPNRAVLKNKIDPKVPEIKRFLSQMGVSVNGGTPRSSISIGFSIMNHPFWGTPILETPRCRDIHFWSTRFISQELESSFHKFVKMLFSIIPALCMIHVSTTAPPTWHTRSVPLVLDVSWIWKNHPLVVQPLKNEQSTVWYVKIAGHNDYTYTP